MKKILFVFAALFAWVGMQQASAQRVAEYQYSQARLIEPLHGVYARPLVANIKVDDKLGRQTYVYDFTPSEVTALEGKLDNIKARALFRAVTGETDKNGVKRAPCDVIVAASFDVKSTGSGTTVTIIGFPGSYVGWETATPADYQWIFHEDAKGGVKADAAIRK